MMWPQVAKWKTSSGVGSLVFAFFWAARMMTALSSLPALAASSLRAAAALRAAIDFSRPT